MPVFWLSRTTTNRAMRMVKMQRESLVSHKSAGILTPSENGSPSSQHIRIGSAFQLVGVSTTTAQASVHWNPSQPQPLSFHCSQIFAHRAAATCGKAALRCISWLSSPTYVLLLIVRSRVLSTPPPPPLRVQIYSKQPSSCRWHCTLTI